MISQTISRRGQAAPYRLFFVVICLSGVLPFTSQAQSGDEALLRRLAENVFSACEHRSVSMLEQLWSEKSPYLPAAKQAFEKTFATNHIDLKSLSIRKITVEEQKATIRVVAQTKAPDGTASGVAGTLNRTFHCVKEAETWKVWRFVSAEEDLAAALASAKTAPERNSLLAVDKELVTVELVRELVAQGKLLQTQSDYPRALDLYELAAGIATTLGEQSALASALSGSGNVLFGQGKLPRALEYFEKSLSISEQLGDKAGVAAALQNAGKAETLLARYKEAQARYEKSLKLSEDLRDDAQTAITLNAMGIVAGLQGEVKQAIEYYDRVRKVGEQLGDKKTIAGALCNAGRAYLKLGDSRQSMALLSKSLSLTEEVGEPRLLSVVLHSIGQVHIFEGNYTEALKHYQMALKIRESMGDSIGIAATLNSIGIVNKALGRYTEALDNYQRSLKIANESGARGEAARFLSNIGNIYQRLGANADAMQALQNSLKIDEEVGNKEGIANALNEIATIHLFQRNDAQALEYYRRSLKIFVEMENLSGQADLLGNIGGWHLDTGDYSGSLEYLTASLRLNEKIGTKPGTANTLAQLGIAYEGLRRYSEALEYYEKGLAISNEIGDQFEIASTLRCMAGLRLAQGDYRQAVDVANRAAVLAKTLGAVDISQEAHGIAGKALRALNRTEDAARAFADAVADIEEMRGGVAGGEQQQERFFETRTNPYYEMVELMIGRENFADAFSYAERSRSRTLLDTLQRGHIDISRAMTGVEQQEERRLNGELVSANTQVLREKQRKRADSVHLAELQPRLERARIAYETFQINLYVAHPELKVDRGQMKPIGPAQTNSLLPDTKTALLEYLVGENKTQLFVFTRPQTTGTQNRASVAGPALKVYTINIKKRDLVGRVQTFRRRLASLDFGIQDLSRELYDLLLAPARAELKDKTNLIIVPDGVLWELPFQALQPAPKRYLIEDSAVSYAPSLTVLLEMTRRGPGASTGSPTLLALGNPTIGEQTIKRIDSVLMDEKLEPLPEAERQVKELANIYGPSRSRIYIGPDAQEAKVKTEAARYGILHLAAHGILNDQNPMYSQVVLSQSEGDINEDGMLEAWEIMKMDLKADLVVLSACETARGKVDNGEGMIGLSWAFFVAGVPTTVASQWSVDSASTTELMLEFHRNLERHKGKAESLRQAMLKLLKSREYNRPFYWAGFVVVGNGR